LVYLTGRQWAYLMAAWKAFSSVGLMVVVKVARMVGLSVGERAERLVDVRALQMDVSMAGLMVALGVEKRAAMMGPKTAVATGVMTVASRDDEMVAQRARPRAAYSAGHLAVPWVASLAVLSAHVTVGRSGVGWAVL
jgi:hypothetical protein